VAAAFLAAIGLLACSIETAPAVYGSAGSTGASDAKAPEAAAAPSAPDAGPGEEEAGAAEDAVAPAADCSGISSHAGWKLCGSGSGTCTAVFEDGAGCAALCAAAAMACVESYENIDGQCAPDGTAPALGCKVTGHTSDYCVCGAEGTPGCVADCAAKSCGVDGCGGSCGTCGAGQQCAASKCVAAPAAGTLPAFIGAEGEGMYSEGGRGGDVYHVTNTNDSGKGSLREGVSGSGARTIVFDTGGIISLLSPLKITRSKLTIAGQTAPGDGIVIRNYQAEVRADHVVIRHLRFRAGDLSKKKSSSGSGFTEDSLTVNGSHIILDHVSASWGIDENASGGSAFDRVTVQYSVIAEGLYHTCLFHGTYDCSHPGHSMGSLFKPSEGDARVSMHHNLYMSNNNRNPAIGTYKTSQRLTADIRNNVIYNAPHPGYTSGASAAIRMNYVGNYLIFGPSNDSGRTHMFEATDDCNVTMFQSGNRRDLNRNGVFDGKDDGWAAIKGVYAKASAPIDVRPVTTHSAAEALGIILEQAGARPWNRDAVDQRLFAELGQGKGKLIDSQSQVGGWGQVAAGTAPVDTDRDGMPDSWEKAHGTNPAVADHNGHGFADGYTNLEHYLHDSAHP
jgi:hypothetical protein